MSFDNGLARIKLSRKTGYVDLTGKVHLEPGQLNRLVVGPTRGAQPTVHDACINAGTATNRAHPATPTPTAPLPVIPGRDPGESPMGSAHMETHRPIARVTP